MEKPTLQYVEAALTTLYTTQNEEERKQADAWLSAAQEASWSMDIAYELTCSEGVPDPPLISSPTLSLTAGVSIEGAVFGANVIRRQTRAESQPES